MLKFSCFSSWLEFKTRECTYFNYINIIILGVITLNQKMPQLNFKRYFFCRGEGSGMGGDDVRRVVLREEWAESEGSYVIQNGLPEKLIFLTKEALSL